MKKSRAIENRAIRQEALRDQLASQGHVQHAVDLIEKFKDSDTKLESDMIQRYRIALDGHLALIKKYLPDLKAMELTGEGGGDINITLPERDARV